MKVYRILGIGVLSAGVATTVTPFSRTIGTYIETHQRTPMDGHH